MISLEKTFRVLENGGQPLNIFKYMKIRVTFEQKFDDKFMTKRLLAE